MTEFPRKVAETPVGKLSYREAGEGLVLLFLHGLGGNARSWNQQLGHFSDRYRVIAWDNPGYGESDVVEPTKEAFAAAALALLDALGVERAAAVIGHSMGGIVATMMTAAAPERVEKLVLSCSFAGAASPEGAPMAGGFTARLDDLRRLTPEAFGHARAVGMTADGVEPAVFETVAAIAAEMRLDGFEAAARMLTTANTRDTLPTINCPTLVLSGAEDKIIAREIVDAMAVLVPHAKRLNLDGVGHAPYVENSGAYNAVLSGFLGPDSV